MALSSTSESQLILCEIINQISLHEQKTEQLRIQLCRRTIFNPYIAYKRLDSSNKGLITAQSLQYFLKDNDLFAQDCAPLIKQWFQKDNLQYTDFLQLVLPKSDSELRELTVLKQPLQAPLDKAVENALAQLLYVEHCETMNLERLKVRLFKICSTKEAFEHIDTLNNSYINFKDVDRFFRRNGLIIYEDELTRFLMRVDIGYTGSLSANDFRRILTPIYESEELSMQRRISQSSQVGQILNVRSVNFDSNHKSSTHTLKPGSEKQFSSQKTEVQETQPESSCLTDGSEKQQQYEQYLRQDTNKFIQFLIEIIKLESYLEETKILLARQRDFNVMDAFHFVDLKSQGKVTKSDMSRFLRQLGTQNINVSKFFNRYDKDEDGYIRYSDFADFLNPVVPLNFEKSPKNSSLSYSITQLFTSETISLLKQVFCVWFSNEEIIAETLSRIVEDLPLQAIFGEIDQFKKGSFNRQDLQRYLNKHGLQEDARIVFRRIAKNKKDVQYVDFVRSLNIYY